MYEAVLNFSLWFADGLAMALLLFADGLAMAFFLLFFISSLVFLSIFSRLFTFLFKVLFLACCLFSIFFLASSGESKASKFSSGDLLYLITLFFFLISGLLFLVKASHRQEQGVGPAGKFFVSGISLLFFGSWISSSL